MKSDTLSISVIICAYTEERWDDLVAAINSIIHQTVPATEIVVVIDHNPALRERVAAEIPGVLAVENAETRGLSGARNSGIRAASGDVVAFMDDDAMAERDWLERLLAGFADERALGVGGAIIPLWAEGRPAWFPGEFDWVVGCTYTGMPTGQTQVRNLIGCNMAFRREVLELAGGFRSSLGRVGKNPAGCEETELCIRARKLSPDGYMLFDPSARVQHRVPAARGTWDYFTRRCFAEGVSKSLVSRLSGPSVGLQAERRYLYRTLPRAVLNGVWDTLRGRDVAGAKRSAAVAAGFSYTLAGYLRGLISISLEGNSHARKRKNERSVLDISGTRSVP